MNFRKIFSGLSRNINVELELAIFENRAENVERLLNKGANPNAYGMSGRERHLHKAVTCSDLRVIEALLDAGANPLLPKDFAGVEFSLVECAEAANRPREIIERVKRAENEAIQKFGPSPPLQKRPPRCNRRKSS